MQNGGLFLGVHTGHDRGATLIKDGKIAVHIPEDRLDRVKHSESQELPFRAIERILEVSGSKLSEIAAIGLSCVNRQSDAYVEFYRSAFEQHFEERCPEIFLAGHHLCHALCCLFTSNDKEVFAYVYDGAGDLDENNQMESETLFRLTDTDHEVLHQRAQDYHESFADKTQFYYAEMMYDSYANMQISLGKKYNQFTARCGFGAFEDGKTMGLAPYGESIFDIRPYVPKGLDFSLTISDLLDGVADARAASGMSYFQFDRERKADLASTIQAFLEDTLLSLTKSISVDFGVSKISLVGGVALNCVANNKVAQSGFFDEVRPFPAAGDDGQSVGAALYALRRVSESPKVKRLLPIYSGPGYSNAEARAAAKCNNLHFETFDDSSLGKLVARKIIGGQVVAVHRGGSEIGPRALGHRSILASATHPNMKDVLNVKVKFREMFRPYAPMVAAEATEMYFDLDRTSPHMMFACSVHENKRELLPSITHVDGTARVQTVSSEDEPFIHSILEEIGRLSGHPVMINTSFNLAGEPVVETPEDAIRTFLRSSIDMLVIGNMVIDRSSNQV